MNQLSKHLLATSSLVALLAGASAQSAYASCTVVTGAYTNNSAIPCVTITNTSFSGDVSNAGTVSPGGISLFSGTISGSILDSGTISATGGNLGISIDGASKIAASGNAISITGPTFTGGISNVGAISSHTAGIYISHASTFTGGIANSGAVSAGQANPSYAWGILSEYVSSFSGGITNSGTISVAGVGSGIVLYYNSSFSGGITNSGTISASRTGISIASVSTFSGSIVNSGQISVSGAGYMGIYAGYGTVIADGVVTFAGGITNSGTGTISVLGGYGIGLYPVSSFSGGIVNNGKISAGDIGIFVDTVSSFSGGITNSGTISVAGGTAVLNGIGIGINFVSNFSGGITNSGTISTSDRGIGIAGTSLGYVSTFSGGITNSGTILAGNTGIYVSGVSIFSGGITNSGTISSKVGVDLLINAGTVTNSGTITGSVASVEFNGTGANALTLQTGSVLNGDAIGSTAGGATNALILQGTGSANNSFVNFNTLNVAASGIWALNGISSIGATTITTGNLQVGDGTHPSAQLTSTVTVNAGATLSGHGTVVGSVTNNGGTISPGGTIGTLAITGNFTQTGGDIVFEIDPNGSGGFLESKLLFDPGQTLSIDNADIIFDFEDGADPLAFFDSGQFDINTFFDVTDGNPFSTDYGLGSVFEDDSFNVTAPGYIIDSFDFTPSAGATVLTETKVPEPSTLAIFLGAGLLCLGLIRRRRTGKHAG